MPRVPCPACATDVVVDPLGRCPEGHEVATAVDRVTSAIGTATDHPDEPEPWTAIVEPEEVDDDAMAEPPPIQVRRPEPVRAPGHDPQPLDAEVDADDLLSELHSLTDLTPSHDANSVSPTGSTATADGSAADGSARPGRSEAGTSARGGTGDPAPPTTPPNPPPSAGLGELEAALRDLTDLPASNGSGPGEPAAPPNSVGDTASTNRTNGHPAAPPSGLDDVVGTNGTNDQPAAPPSGLDDVVGTNGTNGHPGSGPELEISDLEDLFSGMGTPPAATPPAEPAPRTDATRPGDDPTPASHHQATPSAPLAPTTPPAGSSPPPPASPPPGASDASPPSDPPTEAAPPPTPPPSGSAPPPPPTPPPDIDEPSTSDGSLDLANFTAKGSKVDRKGKRRRFGR